MAVMELSPLTMVIPLSHVPKARQTEHMIDIKMHGEGMDGVLARKVHETGPFASFLAGLATKHEVEAMRKV